MIQLFLTLFLSLSAQTFEGQRIVCVGGPVTEIVFALGGGDRVVGVDTSSNFPEAVEALPTVGYQRRLSAEGVLSLSPDLVIADAAAGPPEALEQIRSAGVRIYVVPENNTFKGAQEKIRYVASALGLGTAAEQVIRDLKEDIKVARRNMGDGPKPKVVFIYARGSGTLLISGHNTAANAIIDLAGGVNAISGYEGYKPLTAEAMVAAEPDLLLMMESGLEVFGGKEAVLNAPGVRQTPAGKDKRIVTMDGLYLLGFGPRLGKAVKELSQHFRLALTETR